MVSYLHMSRFLFVLPAVLFVGAGCGPTLPMLSVDAVAERVQDSVSRAMERGAEEVTRQRTGADVDFDITGGGAMYTDPATGRFVAVGESVALPDQFPADIPVYANGTPTSVSVEGNGVSASLLVLTTDSREDIRSWFLNATADAGWTHEGTFDTADNAVLSFTRSGDAAGKLTVTIMPPNLQKEISVLVLRKGE